MAKGQMRRVLRIIVSLVLVGALFATVGWLYLQGDLNRVICGGSCPAQYASAPDFLRVGTPAQTGTTAAGEQPIASTALHHTVAGPLTAPELGTRVGFAAVDARDGTPLAGGGEQTFVPASTTKLLTAFAALEALGPQRRFTTRVLRAGSTLTLVGGGDPALAASRTGSGLPQGPADLDTLADQVARELGGGEYRLGYDATLFAGAAASAHWEDSYVPQVVSPVSALGVHQPVDAGTRSADPARAAAEVFAQKLRDRGLSIVDGVTPASAVEGAASVAHVKSAPLGAIVSQLLRTSDNEIAEVLLRHIALATGQEPSFEGGAAGVRTVLEGAAVFTEGLELHDGSGLSRDNRISPTTLVQTLVAAGREDRTASVLSGLPVAGFDGTVAARFSGAGQARGWARAKTGTLTGVHGLAGIVALPGGRPVAFALLADDTAGIDPVRTEAALDAVTAAMAACGC